MNLKKPESSDWEKLGLSQQKVGKSEVGEVVQIPGSFFIFEVLQARRMVEVTSSASPSACRLGQS